ncbi:hypothetical protein EIP86_011506 [Pleurotus ostreatoroseus]|nr:hypothetical protein EIP86_011506 [Pleurotus ostreatoroseus]
MKVLILGATGFIGLPVARAFVRAGHTVYGQTRSEKNTKRLTAEEITPIVAQPADTAAWISIVATVDVIIEALGGVGGDELKTISEKILHDVGLASTQLRPAGAPKIAYIYTSGTWVHGDNRIDIVTDTTPITNPVPLVAWRPAVEQAVVTYPALRGIVIRPSMVYGYSGSILGIMFARAAGGKVSWFGGPGARQALVHADDLAAMYLRAAEKAPLVAGTIFDAANDTSESVDDILTRLGELTGAEGPPEYVPPSNGYEAACASSAIIRPYLARSLLDWQPHKPNVLDNLVVYYNAWKASVDDA